MRGLILVIFEGLLYLQVVGMMLAGVGWGRSAALQMPAFSDVPANTMMLIGGIAGFLIGVLLTGYGIVLLSINGQLRRINQS